MSSRGAVPARGTPKLVVQADAHYCIARSAGILGIGTNNVVKAALDERRRMDPAQLDATLAGLRAAGHPVVAVVACACATPIGAFDPLERIADICAKYGVWLHVDAAHGGAALLSPRHRHLVAGLERADSLTWDAHKMLFVPALCAFLFYKDKRHSYEAFRQNAPYLFDPSAPGLAEYDSGLQDRGVHETGRGVRVVGSLVAVRAAVVRRHGRRHVCPRPDVLRKTPRRPPISRRCTSRSAISSCSGMFPTNCGTHPRSGWGSSSGSSGGR